MLAYWQDVVAALAALAALVWYMRRRARARGPACEGCPAGASRIVPVSSLRAPEARLDGPTER